MKKFSSVFIILTFLFSACKQALPATEKASSQPTEVLTTPPPETAASAREGVLSEIQNTVSVKQTSADAALPAEQGMSIHEGGSVETGEDGRARIDLMPEGTIVRVGPNSSFKFSKLAEEGDKPKTTLELLAGKVFILLKGGTLNVETPSGVASVRGSLLSVEYNSETGRTSATCMEGDCAVLGEDGQEFDLPEGLESFIDEGESPTDPFLMDQNEVQEWLDENPEMEEFMSELPDPEDFPDLPDDFDSDPEDMPTEISTDEPADDSMDESGNDGSGDESGGEGGGDNGGEGGGDDGGGGEP